MAHKKGLGSSTQRPRLQRRSASASRSSPARTSPAARSSSASAARASSPATASASARTTRCTPVPPGTVEFRPAVAAASSRSCRPPSRSAARRYRRATPSCHRPLDCAVQPWGCVVDRDSAAAPGSWPSAAWRSSWSSSTSRSSTSRCRRSASDLGFSADRPAVGRQRLHADLRGLPAARRARGRPARPPQVFIAGLLLFALASLAGGLAQIQAMLVAARAAQGLGGAVVAPATLSILTTTFAEGAERNRALGAVGRDGRRRRRRGRAARRRAHRAARLAVDPLHQRADRHRRGARRLRVMLRGAHAAAAARATSTSPARSPSPPAWSC